MKRIIISMVVAIAMMQVSATVQHNEMFNEGYGTPLILIVGNGEIKTSLEGLTDTEHFLQFFVGAGMIQAQTSGGQNE